MKKRIFKYIVIFILFIIFFINGVYFYAKLKPKLDIKNVNSFYLYTNNDELYFQGSEKKEWTTLKDISNNLIKSTINIEDKRFYEHHGIDSAELANLSFDMENS